MDRFYTGNRVENGANEAGSAHCRNCVSMESLGRGEADELQDYY